MLIANTSAGRGSWYTLDSGDPIQQHFLHLLRFLAARNKSIEKRRSAVQRSHMARITAATRMAAPMVMVRTLGLTISTPRSLSA
jgi:hypothetical protein